MDNKLTVKFQLLEIETAEFAIIDSVGINPKKIKFTTGLQFGISDANSEIMCNVIIEFFSDEQKLLLKLRTENKFKVMPEDWEAFKNDDGLTIPKGFLAHIAMISVGSSRGILHCKTENTPFNLFVLPLIDVTSMIAEDENFQLD
ncbi:hypothetical protein SAMN05421789_11051 [Kaistella chaponensis]|uniref:Uncharacterized protein n=1 Tax=Kaistella chaponensis TaxID=713588 RepID=A0A1N7MUB5_9FLAO|nr:hypothetical protein [Kaistella chaponensis]SIS89734.1 hypothetical protein SAMN05421789_11051 [Kaistella chaponensis]